MDDFSFTDSSTLPHHLLIEAQRIEKYRQKVYHKEKGLYWRALFRIFVIIYLPCAIYGYSINGFGGLLHTPLIIASILISAIISLFYYSTKSNSYDAALLTKVKKELYPIIINSINSNLKISEEAFIAEIKASELILYPLPGESLSLLGSIGDHYAIVSECRTKVGYDDPDRISLGMFFQLTTELSVQFPIKVFHPEAIEEERRIYSQYGSLYSNYKRYNIGIDQRVNIPQSNFVVYCDDRQSALSFLSSDILKFIDYLLSKYDKNIILSFHDHALTLAYTDPRLYYSKWKEKFDYKIDSQKNMLKNAQLIYNEIMFMNELLTDMNRINKHG